MLTIYSAEPTTAVEALDQIMRYAVVSRASDMHCDPGQRDIHIRARIDGYIVTAGTVPARFHPELISRAKILAGARTDIHSVPQDGRWMETIDDRRYHVRASFMPTYHGENIVLRLLPAEAQEDISLSALGFSPDHVGAIESALRRPSGLIVVTGPTGSGKTTTLHACLSIKSREPISVITLEDPVEYEVPGVRQIHIRHTHGVTFASGLRAALRQDPDVIMVGEIRDAETAHVAIHTALTGHLVLSTIHTTSAFETISRLSDMGIDRYLLASTLKLIIAQRLVRLMCQGCFSIGCEDCDDVGYRGRTVIAEVCEVDADMRNMIMRHEGIDACISLARSRGFRPMREDALEKEEWGITTREETMRALYE